MGLINLYNYGWNEKGRVITFSGLSPTNTFMKECSFKRANIRFECAICKKSKSKGTRYLGDNYDKICSDCSKEWIENSFNALKKIEEVLKQSKEKMIKDEGKWRKEMILGGLE